MAAFNESCPYLYMLHMYPGQMCAIIVVVCGVLVKLIVLLVAWVFASDDACITWLWSDCYGYLVPRLLLTSPWPLSNSVWNCISKPFARQQHEYHINNSKHHNILHNISFDLLPCLLFASFITGLVFN